MSPLLESVNSPFNNVALTIDFTVKKTAMWLMEKLSFSADSNKSFFANFAHVKRSTCQLALLSSINLGIFC